MLSLFSYFLPNFLSPSQFWVEVSLYVGTVLAAFCLGLSKYLYIEFKKKRSADAHDISRLNQHDLIIHSLCNDLRSKVGAARVSFLRFHNGEYFIDGSPIQKISCTHEATNRGAMCLTMDAVQTSLVALGIDSMLQFDGKFMPTSSVVEGRFRRLLESIGTTGSVPLSISLHHHQIIGIILVQWTDGSNGNGITADVLSTIKAASRDIGNEILRHQFSRK